MNNLIQTMLFQQSNPKMSMAEKMATSVAVQQSNPKNSVVETMVLSTALHQTFQNNRETDKIKGGKEKM